MGINLLDGWTSFSDAERRKIEGTLGIKLVDYTTPEEIEAVLLEFESAARRQAEIQARREVIDHYFDRQEELAARHVTLEARVLPRHSAQRYLPEPPAQVNVLPVPPPPRYPAEVFLLAVRPPTDVTSPDPIPPPRNQGRMAVARKERYTPEPETTSLSFLGNVRQYALVTAFTLGGAYLGFSAARHTDLADELRRMEENPIIRAYQVAHEIEAYQGLRELDFLGPEQEKITERREILNSTKKKIGKVGRVIDTLATLVKDVPLLGRGAAIIERQRQQVQLYEQKQEQYSSLLIGYTAAGAGGGFGLGVLLAFYLGRRRKP